MNLRAANENDFAELAKLHKASFAESWDERALKELVAGGAVAIVASQPGRIEGFVLARVAADEAEILTIAVASEVRRRGLGRMLVAEAARVAASEGVTRLFLEVAAGNNAARELYASLGFVAAGLRKGYYHLPGQPPEDALVLAASLPLSGLGNGVRVD